ncbi:EamA family transporter [Paramicrobacterium chengjingii]|uniref:EamA family transporter n=1 Tax=Paramicrobacterium chengjingii TaxID=2769067 RepID=UPI00142309BD|nr:EamA family transporter [Microbacterium chengjingii]
MADAHRSTSGVALVLGSCVSLQFGAALATQLFPDLGSWGVTALRLGIASLVMLVVARPRVRSWRGGQWRGVIVLGVAMAGMNGFFYASIGLIPLSAAVTIEFVGPLLLSALLSRRRLDALWLAIASLGLAAIGVESMAGVAALDPLGVTFALIAAVFWMGYILASARVGSSVPGSSGLAVALAISAVIVLPFGVPGIASAEIDARVVALAVATAVLASALPYSLELSALRRLPRHVFSILLSLEPVAAAFVGWMLLQQPSGPLRLTAIALVIVATFGTTTTHARRTRPPVAHIEAAGPPSPAANHTF